MIALGQPPIPFHGESPMLQTFPCQLVLLAALSGGVAAQDLSQVEITTTNVTANIYMLQGSGGNIAVSVGEDGTFIVDDQFAPLTDKIVAAIAAFTNQPVQFVVNTHWHYDHTDGNENFGEAGAIIVSHENSRRRMESEQLIALFDYRQAPYSAAGLPKITFTEAMRFYYNGEAIDVFHVGPAHTDGDAIIHWVESNVLHTGDVFVTYGFPFIDEPNGGTIEGIIQAVAHLAQIADESTRIIPGHGPLSRRQDLIAYGDMLRTIRDRIASGIAQGLSLDAIIASDPTQGFEQAGTEAGAFVKMAYDSMN